MIELTSYWHLLGEGTHSVNGKTITVNLRELKKKLYLCLMSVNALGSHPFLRQLRLLFRLCRAQADGR
ncbi:ribonucleotide-diphosphate reductase subunit beta [Klebsiella michiganensis]|nr:ribonucleotide-diphosphate reductase subunit beta [Klebsiella michiganensis]